MLEIWKLFSDGSDHDKTVEKVLELQCNIDMMIDSGAHELFLPIPVAEQFVQHVHAYLLQYCQLCHHWDQPNKTFHLFNMPS